jgi:hypothetical protein
MASDHRLWIFFRFTRELLASGSPDTLTNLALGTRRHLVEEIANNRDKARRTIHPRQEGLHKSAGGKLDN